MRTIKVKLRVNSIQISENMDISGIIYFCIGNSHFPEKNWNDFILIILDWWITAIVNLARDCSTTEDLLFMDGPFMLRVEKSDRNHCKVKGYDRRAPNKSEFSEYISFSDLASTILDAAQSIDRMCSKNGWNSHDIHGFKKNIKKLKEVLT